MKTPISRVAMGSVVAAAFASIVAAVAMTACHAERAARVHVVLDTKGSTQVASCR